MKNRTNIFRGRQRWLAIIMSLILIISLFPTMAFATEQLTDTSVDGNTPQQPAEPPAVVLPANYAQIVDDGGTTNDDIVTVSKTLEGTDIENVFDITLTVSTKNKIEEIYKAQDMAVVIVMDISNTMNDPLTETESRYDAALAAANDFIDKFQAEAANYPDVSRKIGYVAFNTNAESMAPLQDCVTAEQASALKSTIATNTAGIINNYVSGDTSRFTNIEAGLKMGYDMLASAQENNKYIIFLSDGFPTTYISSGYNGYNPYMGNQYSGDRTPGTDGYFYDQKKGIECIYATSYSDKGADRADDMAAVIKGTGATIFSIGVGLGDQTVDGYYYNDAGNYTIGQGYSVNDLYAEGDYIIGTTADSYKEWLRNSIGSGYYYDSFDTEGLKAAYDDIFSQIKALNQESVEASWVVSDPMNSTGLNYIDFISFYDKDGVLANSNALYGAWVEGGEDTASLKAGNIIDWDLKNSGFSKVTGDDQTETYTYSLKYRVRLANEAANFVELQDYDTNGRTTLTYQVYNNGLLEDPETIDFPIPVVEGYLCEFEFTKIDGYDNKPLAGATFVLAHDSECSVCAQIGKTVNIEAQYVTSEVTPAAEPVTPESGDSADGTVPAEVTAVADEDGKVRFENIPSGHEYILSEADTTGMYLPSSAQYKVTAAYDQLTITPLAETGATSEAPYNFEAGTFVNFAGVDLYAVKEFSHAETGAPIAVNAGQFTFELLDADKKVIQTKTNDAQGYVSFDTEILSEITETKFYIREVNTGADGITYDKTVYEVTVTPVLENGLYTLDVEYLIEGQETTEGVIVSPVFRNTFTDPVSLTVQKVWDHKDNAQDKYPESILVQLLKNGTPYGEPVTLDGENQWTCTWTDLSGTASWTVQELNTPEGYRSETAPANENNVIVITNTYDPYTPPPTTYVAVRKVWDDNDNAALARPESVKVQLLMNGKAYGKPVELSEATRWAYTWYGLEYFADWEIKEVDVPAGYIFTVSETYTTYIVTNTYAPDVPPPPGDEPEKYNEDDGNGGGGSTTEIPDGDVPLAEIPEEEVPLAEVPKTGAEMNIWPFITLISALSLMVMAVTNRRKTEK